MKSNKLTDRIVNKTAHRINQIQPKSSRGAKLGVWLVVILLLALIGWGLLKRGQSRPTSGPAPDFVLTLFEGYAGPFDDGQVTLSALQGRVVVINFWASWCVSCEQEAALLERIWRIYQDEGVVFIGIAYNDTVSDALDYLRQFGVSYANGLDGKGRISGNAYHVTGAPETFVVDQSGDIAHVKLGPFVDGELEAILDALLNREREGR